MWAHSFKRMMSPTFKVWELCAARVWQLKYAREHRSSQEKCFRSPFRRRIDARNSSRTGDVSEHLRR